MDGKKKLEELVAGLDGVTPGPWQVNQRGEITSEKHDGRHVVAASDLVWGLNRSGANAAHLARCDPDTLRSISDAYKAMEAENERLREALNEFMDITEPASVPAFRDPAHGDEVEALGRRIGFGALISSASASWRDVAKEHGDPPGGEFVVGPCYAVLISVRNRAATILKGSRHEE